MKKVLLIDCQLLQTAALHRGMGKYTLSVLHEFRDKKADYDKIIIVLAASRSNMEDEALVEEALKDFELIRLPLKKTRPTHPEEYGEILEENRSILDGYIKSHYADWSVDFLITSMFQEDGCSAYPSVANGKYLIVYDLIPLQFPHYYLKDARGRYQYLSRYKEFFQANHYFTISTTVANDLALQLGVGRDRITPIHGSYVSRKKIKQKRPTSVDSKDKYVLMPTGDDARKNNLRAVAAFEDFNSKSGYTYKLVITSFFGEKTKNELFLHSNHLVFTGNVKEAEVAWLYSNAELILFPSEYEGLGMPALEAVEFGKPVLCSAIDVFKEISETAFSYCDPYSVDDISRNLQALLINHQPRVPQQEYERILEKYSWRNTANIMYAEFASLHTSDSGQSKEIVHRPRVAIFAPSPSGYSAIGKVVQEQHYELSKIADVDYYLEEGLTERAKTSDVRVNYLPYVAKFINPWTFTAASRSKYDHVIYHVGNSEYHVATIIKALAFPAKVVLHDTSLKEVFSLIRDRGFISQARFHQEEKFQDSMCERLGLPKGSMNGNFIGSLANASERLILHSVHAENAVKQVLVDDTSKILRLNLSTPVPFEVYDIAPKDYFVAGYAGILHPAKGLDMITNIARIKSVKPIMIKLFGFSLLGKEAEDIIKTMVNVETVIKPSDARFKHEMESCSIIIGYRPDYHGETSLSTLEALRLGRPVVVNNVGWFKELPDGIVYKVADSKGVLLEIERAIKEDESAAMVQKRVEYVRKHHGVEQYINGMLSSF